MPFSVSLLTWHTSRTRAFRIGSKRAQCSGDETEANNVRSSAYSQHRLTTMEERSLLKNRNSRGPSMDSFGTPEE